MKNKKEQKWLILATVSLALLAGIFYVFDLRFDEPPPDISDLLLDYVETPTPGTFGALLAEEKLTLERAIREKIDDELTATFEKCRAQEGRYDRPFDYWDGAAMDRALAGIPEGFWQNLDAALIAPRERVIGNPHIFTVIHAARMLEIKAQRLAQKGETAQALRLTTQIVVLGKAHSQTDFSIVSALGALAIQGIGYRAMGSISLDKPIADDFLREIQRTVQENKLTDEDLLAQLKGEFTYMSRTFLSPNDLKKLSKRAGRNDFDNFITGSLPFAVTYKPNKTLRIYADWCRGPLMLVGEKLAELPNKGLDEVGTILALKEGRFPFDPANRVGRFWLNTYCTGYGSALRRWIGIQSQNSAIEAMLAVRRYELKEGKLPENLAMLVPEYLDAVPLDYVDHQPIRYSAEKRVLWSLGSDPDKPITDPLAAWEGLDAPREFVVMLHERKPETPAEENDAE